MKHSFKDWLGVTRFWSFPVSAMPVVAGALWDALVFTILPI